MPGVNDQSSDQMTHQRADDNTLRKVIIGISAAIIVQAIGWVYMAGTITNQVDTNTKTIDTAMSLIQKQGETSGTVIRIETLVEGLAASMQQLSTKLENVADEQTRRGPIVDRADRYMERGGQ